MKLPSLPRVATVPTSQVTANLKSFNPKAPPVYKPDENRVNRNGISSLSSASTTKCTVQPKPGVGTSILSRTAIMAVPEGAPPLTSASPRRDAIQRKPVSASGAEKRPAPPIYGPNVSRSAPPPYLQRKRSMPVSVVQRMQSDTVESSSEREALSTNCADLHTTLVTLEKIILWIATESKNQIDKAPMESFNFTCSIKKGSVINMIFRCSQLASYRGSQMTHGLAWYNSNGDQAKFNKYGPHITFSSPRKPNQNDEIKYVAHHIFFLNGETAEVK